MKSPLCCFWLAFPADVLNAAAAFDIVTKATRSCLLQRSEQGMLLIGLHRASPADHVWQGAAAKHQDAGAEGTLLHQLHAVLQEAAQRCEARAGSHKHHRGVDAHGQPEGHHLHTGAQRNFDISKFKKS